MPDDPTSIYFSDFFGIPPALLEEYGAYNVSLINDLPLFVDPFLLFNSTDAVYRQLHESIITYLRFLTAKASAGSLNDGLLENWFTFREIKENWLGYSQNGNKGSGLGLEFARALSANLASLITSFGSETVTRGSHLEKICLIGTGVGKDNISDFTTNLIKGYLLKYTEAFSLAHISEDQRRSVAVAKANFNYQTETWESQRYSLPYTNGGYVILTPLDLLTKDEIWINREDMYRDYASIVDSIPNHQLRAQLNNYFSAALTAIQERDEAEKERRAHGPKRRRRRRGPPEPSSRQRSEAIAAAIAHYPEFVDHYIRFKEDHGDEAEAQADERVRSSERLYIAQVRELAGALFHGTEFYRSTGSTLTEARERVRFLKDVIENKGGWRLFYADGEPLRREADLHIMFRLTWCNTPSDVSREVNDGRGPADFKVSRGRLDMSIVEFKLAKNTALPRNLQHQAEAYKKAADAQHALKVIVFFTEAEEIKTRELLRSLRLHKHRDVILIDARSDNKDSASRL